MFNPKVPTGMLLGRFQPFHDGHFQLGKHAIDKYGQVCIMVRDTQGTNDKNPFDFNFVTTKIDEKMTEYQGKSIVIQVPNISDIIYGRDVGYKISQINLGEEIEKISATKLREEMKVPHAQI